jgi:flagellar L-ring protein FlgH
MSAMTRLVRRVTIIAILLLVSQFKQQSGLAADTPALRLNDVVIVVFKPGTIKQYVPWSNDQPIRIAAQVTNIDANGVASINGNRKIYVDGWVKRQSISGTIRVKDIGTDRQIESDQVDRLKLSTFEARTPLPDEQKQ